jgi:hypothetical protein
MKTKILSALISTTLVMSLGSVQAAEEETVAITPTDTQLEIMWQEGQEMPGILSELTSIEILPMATNEMGETIGSRNCRRGRCCRGSR